MKRKFELETRFSPAQWNSTPRTGLDHRRPLYPISVWLLPLVLTVLMGCRAQSDGENENVNNRPSPETVKTESPAPDKATASDSLVGNRTPGDALEIFFGGIADGDAERAISAAVDDEMVRQYVQAIIRVNKAWDDFAQTDNEHFGADGEVLVGLIRQSVLKQIEGQEPKVIDENHVVYNINPSRPLNVTKFSDGWKIDFGTSNSPEELKTLIAFYESQADMYETLQQRIINKQLTSRIEVRRAMALLKAKRDR